MERLNFQDSIFLRLESADRPFHVGGLALFSLPRNVASDYLSNLARTLGQLPRIFPALGQKLNQPDAAKTLAWVDAEDYDPAYHVLHYGVPAPGRDDELIKLVTRVHERCLDRSRPLWELHLVEGLAGNRFALYFKFHHALVDGVGALHMVNTVLGKSADVGLDLSGDRQHADHQRRISLLRRIGNAAGNLVEQGMAIPEVSSMLGQMGRGLLEGPGSPLPFSAPQSLFNQKVSNRRCLQVVELPLNKLREIGNAFGGTINDVLVALCGGAIRSYLLERDELPEKSLLAGMPLSIKGLEPASAGKVSTIICPLGSDLDDPAERIARIIEVTRQSKAELRTQGGAGQDYMNLVLIPGLLQTLLGSATRVPPPFNLVVSNTHGSRQRLYLEGSKLDAMYPLSLVTDTQGLNITAISYMSKLCLGIVACPGLLPGIDTLGDRIKAAYRELGRSY